MLNLQKIWMYAERVPAYAYEQTRLALLREQVRAYGKRDAVFIWIPKTAGTSLHACLNAPKLKNLRLIRKRFAGRGVVTFGHIDYTMLVAAGYIPPRFDQDAYKFAFSRNPYTRAVSLWAYLSKMGRLDGRASFLDFCRSLQRNGCEPIGLFNARGLSQCNPQVRWLENLDLDFLGKVETLEQDAARVFRHLGIACHQVPSLNQSRHGDCSEYYCSESQDIVEDFYRDDFEALGYTMGQFTRKAA